MAKPSRRIDRQTLDDLAAILSAIRRVEDTAGASAVLETARGIGQLSLAAVSTASSQVELAAARLASEIGQYLGWLELAAGDGCSAQRQLDRAVRLAEQARDPDRLVHGLSFRAYAAQLRRKLPEAADLIEAALRIAGGHPLLHVYDGYQRARIHALACEQRAAQQRLVQADQAAEVAAGGDLPDGGYWYTDGFWGLQRGLILGILGQEERALHEAELGLAALPAEQRHSEWATDLVTLVHESTRHR